MIITNSWSNVLNGMRIVKANDKIKLNINCNIVATLYLCRLTKQSNYRHKFTLIVINFHTAVK